MFHLQLATVPGQLPGPVTLILETLQSFATPGPGSPLRAPIVMPAPGTATRIDMAVPATFMLRMELRFGADRVGVVIGPLRDDDTLGLIGGITGHIVPPTGQPHVNYSGTVVHQQSLAQDENCGLRCDGDLHRIDRCCVSCTKNSITVKACC